MAVEVGYSFLPKTPSKIAAIPLTIATLCFFIHIIPTKMCDTNLAPFTQYPGKLSTDLIISLWTKPAKAATMCFLMASLESNASRLAL